MYLWESVSEIQSINEGQVQGFCKSTHICARSLLQSTSDQCCTTQHISTAQRARSLLHSTPDHYCTACQITTAQHATSLLHSMLASKVPVTQYGAAACDQMFTCFACIRQRQSAHNSEHSCNITYVKPVVCNSLAVFK